MDIKDIHNAYFIGIGGIGMSALARYFVHMGKKVAGYDKTRTPLCEAMEDLGIEIHYEDDIELIPGEYFDRSNTLVIYTPAVPKGLRELNYFTDDGFVVKKRSEVLGLITQDTFCSGSWRPA